jgi:hypothetical protein
MLPESQQPNLSSEAGKAIAEKDSDVWNGFYQKPLQTRLDQLKLLYPDLTMKGLPSDIADSMIENCIGMLTSRSFRLTEVQARSICPWASHSTFK